MSRISPTEQRLRNAEAGIQSLREQIHIHELYVAALRRNAESPPPAPSPITCCGDWTWDGRCWRYSGADHPTAPTCDCLIVVCRNCHRALLAHGRMTGRLVDVEAASDRAHDVFGGDFLRAKASVEDMLYRTWGPSDE